MYFSIFFFENFKFIFYSLKSKTIRFKNRVYTSCKDFDRFAISISDGIRTNKILIKKMCLRAVTTERSYKSTQNKTFETIPLN